MEESTWALGVESLVVEAVVPEVTDAYEIIVGLKCFWLEGGIASPSWGLNKVINSEAFYELLQDCMVSLFPPVRSTSKLSMKMFE